MENITQIKQKMDISLQRMKELEIQLKPISDEMKEQLEIIKDCRDQILSIRDQLKK
jgi:hypothetical protein